jgi:hypothetical protein
VFNPTGVASLSLGMAALPCCAEEDVEAGSAALRVDWPVYPRRAEKAAILVALAGAHCDF